MKYIVAIIRPEKLEAVQEALEAHEIVLMTVSDVAQSTIRGFFIFHDLPIARIARDNADGRLRSIMKKLVLFLIWVLMAAIIIVAFFIFARCLIDATSGPPAATRP